MQFIGWMMDVAREQSPSEAWLEALLHRSRDAGYNAVGLYLEHRFAYKSAPWAAGRGCLTPEVVHRLAERFRGDGPRIIPFLNTLGHMEGFLRAEDGQRYAESPRKGSLQLCPSRPECIAFTRGLVADALDAFDDEWVHLGGDETGQLGRCPLCAERAKQIGKAGLYGEYFGPLCRWVLERGRRPCLWGDMLLAHPEAMEFIPRQTVTFDWQYEHRPRDSTRRLRDHGFDVVCCPSVQTYNSAWCFLDPTRANIDEHAADARELGALGVLVTTWEFCFFSRFASILPIVLAAGRRLARGEDWHKATTAEGGPQYAQLAELLGNRIPAASAFLKPGTWRQLRDRLVIRRNPFELWKDWREEARGPVGDTILRLCDEADALLDRVPHLLQRPENDPQVPHPFQGWGTEATPEAAHALRFAIELHRVAIQWVRSVEHAHRSYTDGNLTACVDKLQKGRERLERLRPGLRQAADGGGSVTDMQRLEELVNKVDGVCERVADLPTNSAHRPAFETLVDDAHLSGDQAAWDSG